MAAAHLLAPDVAEQPVRFVTGCTGRPAHTKAEAEAAVTRRGVGRAYQCRCCRAWHTWHDRAEAPAYRYRDQA